MGHQNFDRVVASLRWVRLVCPSGLGSARRPRDSALGRLGVCHVQQPMVTIDFSDGIGCTVGEDGIEVFDFGLPFLMWPELTFGEHEGFSGIEKLVDDRQVCMIAGDLEDAR